MSNADINDISLYKPASTIVKDSIEELYNDEYDSIEDLLIHEMLEKESLLEDGFLLKMSQMYCIPYDELVKARPGAEAKLKKELEEKISIQEAFDCYTDDLYSEDDE